MGDKVGVALSTYTNESDGKEAIIISITPGYVNLGIIVVSDPLYASGHFGVSCVSASNKKTIEDAKKLGKRVVFFAKKLKT